MSNDTAQTAILHEFFGRAVRCWPDCVAVDIPPGKNRNARVLVTYAELDVDSNSLAEVLGPHINVESECIVGILLPRTSAQLYATQLAVLKSGAAYTCIDLEFPDERVCEILEDAKVSALLTDGAGVSRIRSCGLDQLPVIDVNAAVNTPSSPRGESVTPERLAYVIYTSGTTGRPKGVMIEHRSIANLIASDLEAFQLSPADRVVQSSSAAYDSSIEETWLAFAAGATAVVMDDDTARSGPDLISWLERELITVFCPTPTLLRATGCQNPEAALPGLKMIYVGGEPLPRDVADRWSRDRRLVNGYGPTECAVTCLRNRVESGQPIAIGRPIDGMKAWALNDALEETAPGEHGELCIGGVGLARGYWRSPELTAEKFITHPRLGRIYRTGDLVHCDPAGNFFYDGRIDSQVKLRGYRIELGEIESRLAECPGVRAAACSIQKENGHDTIVAFVVPDNASLPLSADELRNALEKVLPGYMVPGRFGFLSELPTTVSGKLARAALPRLTIVDSESSRERMPPRNILEAKIEAAFADILGRKQGVSIHADFFENLGGDSLNAAQLITLLRDDPATAWVTVRDIYEVRTVAGLAERAPGKANASNTTPSSFPRDNDEPPIHSLLAGIVQTAWIAKNLLVTSVLTYLGMFYLLPLLISKLGVIPLLLLAPPATLAGLALYTPLSVLYAARVKKVLIGQYRPMSAPVWGDFYLRNWMVQQTMKLVPWWLIEGTEFQNAALRALGARIGKRVHLHRGVDLLRGGWDLLEIGDDVTIGQDAAVGLVEYEAGQIVIGAVSLENGCTIETQSYVGAGARVEANGFLSARAALPRGSRLPPCEKWEGIPARPSGKAPDPPPLTTGERLLSPKAAALCMALAKLTLLAVLAAPLEIFSAGLTLLLNLDGSTAAAWLSAPAISPLLLLGCVAAVTLQLPFMLVAEALACRVMGRVSPGVISLWSPGYIQVWLKAGLLDSGSRWLYGTLFWPSWLRLAGMKIGRDCEISTLIDTVPELVEIGDHTFCADGIYLSGPRIHRGTVTLAATRIGRNNFLGNGAIIPGGASLPDDVLLGVCTVADPSLIRHGTAWFGEPAFELPRREIISLDRRLTHHPSAFRYLVRLFWELLRFSLPAAFAVIIPGWYFLMAKAEVSLPFGVRLLMAFPLLNFLALFATTAFVIGIKWVLLGRIRPGVHPLWSSWASRWDVVCIAWDIYATEMLSMLDGTPWLAYLLRAIGVHVGKGVVFGNGFASSVPDPDMLTFEDGATVDCLIQSHTFEDRVLKTDRVTIRRNASVGRNAVLLYGAEIGVATRVAPNSVVMKQEHLLPNRLYIGFPVRAQD